MHLVSSYPTSTPEQTVNMHATAVSSPPFGPAFDLDKAEQADKLEVWGSSFNDAGPDFCEFRLIKDDKTIATKRVEGF